MKLYNTLSRKIEKFEPLEDKIVKMYTCGLTVYSQPQIGNWVAYIYSDVLSRVLMKSGYKVNRVQNITDVGHLVSDDDGGEDKMEKGAKAEGITAWNVAEKYIAIADKEGYEWLKLLKPRKLVRATDLIPEQILFAHDLEKKGFTYLIPGEGLYFDTTKLSDYGKLARLDVEGLKPGARVDIAGKKHPTDFALWKLSPKNSKRDMEWDSPWGVGFPGWHLECSVIARESLGDQIDIHTGGIDHIPVHHTNEIAQSESLTGKQFVKYWFHNNHMKINGSKMAKSSGNSYTLEDLKKKGINLNAFKLMVLSSHYRTEGNFTWKILEAAQNRYKHWQAAADRAWQPSGGMPDALTQSLSESTAKILSLLQEDMNTPETLKEIDRVVSIIEDAEVSSKSAVSIRQFFDFIEEVLGIEFIKEDINNNLKLLINDRSQARVNKDFQKSDTIRDELLKAGIGIRDVGTKSLWFRT